MGVDSMFTIVSNKEAMKHREPMSPFFSRRNVFNMEFLIRAEVKKMIELLEKTADTGAVLDMHSALRAVAFDILTDVSFEFSYNAIDRDDLGVPFMQTVEGLVWVWMLNAYLFGRPVMAKIMSFIPSSFIVNEGSTALNRWLAVGDPGSD